MIKRYVDDLTSPIYYIAGLPDMASAMKTVLTFFQTGFGAFFLNNPIFSVLMGGLVVLAVLFKFKHMSGLLHRKGK